MVEDVVSGSLGKIGVREVDEDVTVVALECLVYTHEELSLDLSTHIQSWVWLWLYTCNHKAMGLRDREITGMKFLAVSLAPGSVISRD